MSWVADEWKDGLPVRALQRIEQIEKQSERIKKERDQKQFQLDSLEQALQNQRRKCEEEKNEQARLKRENQSLSEACDDLEKKREKLQQELHTKTNHLSCLEGQLSHCKQNIDSETHKATQFKNELEQAQHDHTEWLKKFEKLTADHHKLQEYSNHQKSQLESQNEKIRILEMQLKQLPSVHDRGSSKLPTTTTKNEVNTEEEVKKQLMEVKEEREKEHAEYKQLKDQLNMLKSQNNPDQTELLLKLQNLKRENDELSVKLANQGETTPNKINGVAQNQQNSQTFSSLQIENIEKTSDKFKKENDALKTGNANLEMQIHAKNKQVQELNARVQKLEEEMGQSECTIEKKEKMITQCKEEYAKLKTEMEHLQNKILESENKNKKLKQEMACNQHNAEAVHKTLELKVKDKEKELKLELSQQMEDAKIARKLLEESKHKMQQEINQEKNAANRVQQEIGQLQKELSTVKHELTSLRQSEQDVKTQLVQSQSLLKQKEDQYIAQCKTMEKLEHETRRQIEQEINEAKVTANKEIIQLKNDLKSGVVKTQEMESTLKGQICHFEKLLEQKNEAYNVLVKKVEKLEQEMSELGHNSERKVNSVVEERDKFEKLYQMQLTEKQEELKLKDSKINQLIMELDKVRHCFFEMQVGYDKLKMSFSQLKEEKTDVEKVCTGLGEKLEDLKCDRTNLEEQHKTQLDNMKASLETSQQILHKLQTEHQSTSEQLSSSSAKVAEMEKIVQALESEKENIKEKLQHSENSLAQMTKDHSSLVSSVELVREQLAEKEEQFQKTTSELESTADALKQKDQHLTDCKETWLEKDKKQQHNIDEKNQQVAELEKRFNCLETELDQLRCNHSAAVSQAEEMKQLQHTKDTEIETLKETISSQEKSLSELAENFSQKDGELQETEAQHSNLQDQYAAQSNKIEMLMQDIERKSTELEEMKKCFDEVNSSLGGQLSQLQADHEDIVAKLDQAKAALQEKTDHSEALENELSSLKKTAEEFHAKLHDNEESLKERQRQMEDEKEKCEDALRESKIEKDKLLQEISEITNNNGKMQAKLEMMQMDLEDSEEASQDQMEKLQQAEQSVQELKTSLGEKQEHINETQKNLDHVSIRFKECEAVIVDMKEKKLHSDQMLEHQKLLIDNHNRQLQEECDRYEEITKECCTLKQQLQAALDDNDELVKKTEQQSNHIVDLEKTVEKLETLLKEKDEICVDIEAQCCKLTEEMEKLQAEIKQQKELFVKQTELNSVLQEKVCLLQSESTSSLADSNKQIENFNMKLTSALDENAELVKKTEQLDNVIAEQEGTIAKLKTVLEEKDVAFVNIEEQCCKLSEELDEMKVQLLLQKQSVLDLTEVNRVLQEKVGSLENELSSSLADSNTQLENLNVKLTSALDNNAELVKKTEQLNNCFAEQEGTIAKLKTLLEETNASSEVLEAKCCKLAEELGEIQEIFQQQKQSVVDLTEVNKGLQEKVILLESESSSSLTDSNKQLENLNIKLTSALDDNAELVKKTEQLNNCFAEQEGTIAKLKTLLEEKNASSEQIEAKCCKLAEELFEIQETFQQQKQSVVDMTDVNKALQEKGSSLENKYSSLLADSNKQLENLSVKLTYKQDVFDKKLEASKLKYKQLEEEKFSIQRQMKKLEGELTVLQASLMDSQNETRLLHLEKDDDDKIFTLKEETLQTKMKEIENQSTVLKTQHEEAEQKIVALNQELANQTAATEEAELKIASMQEENDKTCLHYEEQCKALKESIEHLETVIENLKKNLYDKISKLSELEQNATEEANIQNFLKTKLDDSTKWHQEEQSKLEDKISSLEVSLQDNEDRRQQFEKDMLEQLMSKDSEIQDKIMALKNESSLAKSLENKKDEEVDILSQQLVATEQEVNLKLAQSLEQYGSLEAEMISLKDKYRILQDSYDTKSAEMESMQGKLQQELDELRLINDKLNEQNLSLTEDLEASENESQDLKRQVEVLKDDIKDFTSTNMSLDARLAELQAELEDAQVSSTNQENKISQVSSSLAVKIEETKSMSLEIETLKQNLVCIENTHEQLQAEYAHSLQEHQTVMVLSQDEKESLKQQLLESKTELKERSSTCDELRGDLVSLEEQMKSIAEEKALVVAKIEETSSVVADTSNHVNSLSSENKMLKEQLVSLESLQNQLEGELETAVTEHKHELMLAEDKLVSQKQQLCEMETETKMMHNEIKNLQAAVVDLERESTRIIEEKELILASLQQKDELYQHEKALSEQLSTSVKNNDEEIVVLKAKEQALEDEKLDITVKYEQAEAGRLEAEENLRLNESEVLSLKQQLEYNCKLLEDSKRASDDFYEQQLQSKLEIEQLRGEIQERNSKLSAQDIELGIHLSEQSDSDNRLKEVNTDLQTLLEKQEVNMVKLNAELDELKELIVNKNEQITLMKDDQTHLKSTVDENLEKIVCLEMELETSKVENRNLKDEIENAAEDSQIKINLIENLEKSIADLQSSHSILEQQFQGTQSELQCVNKFSQSIQSQMDHVTDDCRTFQNKLHDLENEKADLENRLAMANEKVDELESDLKEITAKTGDISEEKHDLTNVLQELKFEIAGKDKELDDFRKKYADFEDKVRSLEHENFALISSLEGQKSQNNSSEWEKKEMEQSIQTLESQLQAATFKCETLETDKAQNISDYEIKLNNEIASFLELQDNCTQLKNELTENKGNFANLKIELANLKLENLNLEKMLKESKLQNDELSSCIHEIKEVKETCIYLQKTIENKEKHCTKHKNELKEAKDMLKTTQMEATSYEEEVKAQEKQISELKTQLNTLETARHGADTDVETFKDMIESMEMEVSSLEGEKMSLISKVESSQKEVQELSKNIHCLQTELQTVTERKVEQENEHKILVEKLQTENTNLNYCVDSLNAEKKEEEQKLEKACHSERKLSEQNKTLQFKYSSLEKVLTSEKSSGGKIRQELVSLQLKHITLRSENGQLKDKCKTQENEKRELLSQFLTLEDQKANLEKHKLSLIEEINELHSDLEKKGVDIQKFQKQLVEAERKYVLAEDAKLKVENDRILLTNQCQELETEITVSRNQCKELEVKMKSLLQENLAQAQQKSRAAPLTNNSRSSAPKSKYMTQQKSTAAPLTNSSTIFAPKSTYVTQQKSTAASLTNSSTISAPKSTYVTQQKSTAASLTNSSTISAPKSTYVTQQKSTAASLTNSSTIFAPKSTHVTQQKSTAASLTNSSTTSAPMSTETLQVTKMKPEQNQVAKRKHSEQPIPVVKAKGTTATTTCTSPKKTVLRSGLGFGQDVSNSPQKKVAKFEKEKKTGTAQRCLRLNKSPELKHLKRVVHKQDNIAEEDKQDCNVQ